MIRKGRWACVAAVLLLLVACRRGAPANSTFDLGTPRATTIEERTRQAVKHLTDGPFGYGGGFTVLVELGPGAFPTLKRLIDQGDVVDPDELVRIAQAIGRRKSPLGEPVLLAIVGANKALEPEVLIALGEIHAPSALSRLRAALHSPSASLRAAAIEGMAQLDDARAVADLLEIIEQRDVRASSLARANPDRYPARLDERAAEAIDHLTRQKLGGSPARIRKWLTTRPDAASP
jgi:HEAT repeats